jgi:sulfide:quinone oxidoreductase
MIASDRVRNRFDVVIVGGGFAGISVAARLRRRRPGLSIAVVEPSDRHYYQPAWTLVGGGAYDIARTCRDQASMIPSGVQWIRAYCMGFQPSLNIIQLGERGVVGYRMLVVAAGLQLDWDRIEGLAATLGENGVTSNYDYACAPYTWECIRNWRGGRAVFTQPLPPFKCAGAPQKILYLAADHWRRRGLTAQIEFYNAGGAMFSVPFFSAALDEVMADYGARAHTARTLVAVEGPARKAWFETTRDGRVQREQISFDLLHVVPPQSAPSFIRASALADAAGWVEVDKETLQHVRYENIFSLGDVCSAPTSKTAAAVRGQIPVVVGNLLRVLEGKGELARYDGYASCPLVTSRGKVMLAEFCYGGEVTPSFPLEPRVPRRLYWWMKKFFLPRLYWDWLTRGRDFPQTHKPRRFDAAVPSIAP